MSARNGMTGKNSMQDRAVGDVFQDIPATNEQVNTAVQTPDPRELRNLLIIQDLERDLPYREIAAMHNISLGLVAKIAKAWHATEGISRKLMAAGALGALDDWRDARKEAAKKGDHRPAKDWLLHAQEIEPLADSPKLGIQINVGNGSAPVQDTSSIPTITVQPQPAQPLTGE